MCEKILVVVKFYININCFMFGFGLLFLRDNSSELEYWDYSFVWSGLRGFFRVIK